jgi:hypothetical protein
MVEPAPPYPAIPSSAVGRKVADVLATLRELRKGVPPKQIRPPRKARQRRVGELSLTEFGAHIGLGPRKLRKRLLSVGLLQTEIEIRDRGGVAPEYQHTARLTAAAVKAGLGRRLEPRIGSAYDVLTRKGQEWAADRLRCRGEERKPNPRRDVREGVRQLLRQGKTQAEISRIMGLSKQRIHYLAKSMAA